MKLLHHKKMEKLDRLQLKLHDKTLTFEEANDYNNLALELNELNQMELVTLLNLMDYQPTPTALSKSDEKIEESIKTQPEQNDQKKTEEPDSKPLSPSLQDKIDAIFEMLPLIKEAYNICQFMLENR